MNDDMRADYPQIKATIKHVQEAADEIGSVRAPESTEFPSGLPEAALLGPAADVSRAYLDCQDMLFARLVAFADAADKTVMQLDITDTEFAEMLSALLPR